jgi:hypothetical protein
MRNLLITGNAKKGLASELFKLYPTAEFVSRSTGWDLTDPQKINDLAELSLRYDIFINNSALWKFHQTMVLEAVYKCAKAAKHNLQIICIGSTTDRATRGSDWLYQQEKKALRSYCNSLNLSSVWEGGPQVTLLSLGSLSNVQDKHPNRVCMDIAEAAKYIKWVVDIPPYLSLNELSIDPKQRTSWHEQ